jgi:hypothetical protein
MSILDYTAEETALIAAYHDGTQAGTIMAVIAALSDMDTEMRSIATGSVIKLAAMSNQDFAVATFASADDMTEI